VRLFSALTALILRTGALISPQYSYAHQLDELKEKNHEVVKQIFS
jgi:hypothetical protein